MERTFPGTEWRSKHPQELGFSESKLGEAEKWLLEISKGEPFRVVVARYGYIAAEWNHGIDATEHLRQASASKSFYSCLLGIAVAEGKIPSVDSKVVDFYPEMMDVKEGEGPKTGRHAFHKDRNVTFRQLIGNTSGYMKPGEEPGKHFHYQTFGMNIVTNSLATIYGVYDSGDPDRLPGCASLMEQKLRDPIGGTWSHGYTDFDHPPGAKKNIFGHSLSVLCTARDSARVGHLWLNMGQWNGEEVVPEEYLRQATVTNSDVLANEPEENWRYGQGFWVNDHGKQWPMLPRDSFAAWGAGAKHIWVSPAYDLVVALNPGPWTQVRDEKARLTLEQDTLCRIVDAVV